MGKGEEGKKGKRKRRGRRTDAMNSPKAPPSAKPITPETAVLPGHDSISFCICGIDLSASITPSPMLPSRPQSPNLESLLYQDRESR